MPRRPRCGSQKLSRARYGLRVKEPGGYGRPRSRTHTRCRAWARRKAVTNPPKPEPTMTTSKWPSVPFPLIGATVPDSAEQRATARGAQRERVEVQRRDREIAEQGGAAEV